MPNPAERVIAAATRHIGVSEQPPGSNSGPRIDGWIARWGLQDLPAGAKPWCGMFADAVYFEAGVDDDELGHPATAEICRRARASGAIVDRPIAGAMIVWCGTHVEIVVEDLGDGRVRTIGGNTGDAVRERVRSTDGATIVAPRAIRESPPPGRARQYLLEDIRMRPRVVGPWRTKAMRDLRLRRLAPAVRKIARPVRVGKGFGIALVPTGRRFYGPWADEAARARARRTLEARLGRTLRPFSRVAPRATAIPAAEELGRTV